VLEAHNSFTRDAVNRGFIGGISIVSGTQGSQVGYFNGLPGTTSHGCGNGFGQTTTRDSNDSRILTDSGGHIIDLEFIASRVDDIGSRYGGNLGIEGSTDGVGQRNGQITGQIGTGQGQLFGHRSTNFGIESSAGQCGNGGVAGNLDLRNNHTIE